MPHTQSPVGYGSIHEKTECITSKQITGFSTIYYSENAENAIKLTDLEPGENSITLHMEHVSGDISEYTLKVNIIEIKDAAGITDENL